MDYLTLQEGRAVLVKEGKATPLEKNFEINPTLTVTTNGLVKQKGLEDNPSRFLRPL